MRNSVELDFVGPLNLAFIGAPEHGLDATVEDAGLLQDRSERCAGPARITDAAIEKRKTMIARTFDRERNFLPRSRFDVGEV